MVFNSDSGIQWTTIAYGSVHLGSGVSSFGAEFAGVEGLAQTLLFLFSQPGKCGDAPTGFCSCQFLIASFSVRTFSFSNLM